VSLKCALNYILLPLGKYTSFDFVIMCIMGQFKVHCEGLNLVKFASIINPHLLFLSLFLYCKENETSCHGGHITTI
jgi:hypothetical protein